MMKTLNELAHLRDSEFGRPWPRHGLKLLYWFAKDCVSFENGNIMLSECDPADGDFGFHYFENRCEDYRDKLLPDIDFPYYVVGNLNSPGAQELPDYVSKDKYPDQHNSNTDRIIVSLSKERQVHRVYVTQHLNQSNYDPNATYRISRALLMIIRRQHLKDFLKKMGYKTSIQPDSPQTTSTVSQDATASSSDSDGIESETENSDSTPLINSDKSMEKTSKNESRKKESCNGCCAIL